MIKLTKVHLIEFEVTNLNKYRRSKWYKQVYKEKSKHLEFLLWKGSDNDRSVLWRLLNAVYGWKEGRSKGPIVDIDISESDHLGLGPTLNSCAILNEFILERRG